MFTKEEIWAQRRPDLVREARANCTAILFSINVHKPKRNRSKRKAARKARKRNRKR